MPLLRTVLEAAPSGLSAQAISSSQINLAWTANPRATGGYRVYRNGTLLQSTTATNLTVTGLSPSTAYSFTVSSVGTQEGPQSAAANATTLTGADTTPPSVPGTPVVTALGSTSLRITWSGSTDTGGSGLAGYKLERSANGSTGWTQIVQQTQTSYDDSALSAFTQYYYRVRAYDGAANNSTYSAVANGTTLASTGGNSWPLQSPSGIRVIPGLEGAATDTAGGFSSDTPNVILLNDLTTSSATVTAVPGYSRLYQGSLRGAAAFSRANPDTILVCNKSGTITLNSDVAIGSRTSIWGQFAPGNGLLLRATKIRLVQSFPSGPSATDVDLQHLDIRAGDTGTGSDADSDNTDGISLSGTSTTGVNGPTRVFVYKCGLGHTRDEIADANLGGSGDSSLGFYNCVFFEPFDYSNHQDTLATPIDRHPYGPIIGTEYRWGDVTVQRCLFAHMQSRMPMVTAIKFNYLNNVIYNPANSTFDIATGVTLTNPQDVTAPVTVPMYSNFVGNLIIRGAQSYTSFEFVRMPTDSLQPAGSQGFLYGNAVYGWTYANQDALRNVSLAGWSQPSIVSQAWKTGWGSSLQGIKAIGTGPNPNSFSNAEMQSFAQLVKDTAGPRPFLRGTADRAGVVAGHAVNRISGSGAQGNIVNSVDGTANVSGWPNTNSRFAPNAGGWPTITETEVNFLSPGANWVSPLPIFNGAPDNRILTSGTFADGQSKVGMRTLQAWMYEQDLYATYGLGAVTVTQGTLATDLKITSTTGGSQPFTFGQAFVEGEVPAGNYVTSTDATSIQCDIRNRWSDGSAKYGVISGIATFTANVQKTFNLTATPAAPTGSDVAEPTSLTASVTFTGDVTGTYTLQSCLGVDLSTWSKSTAGRVRSIPGKVMSEFHYYRPTGDAHVAIWWYVRRYSNGTTEIETVIENGWLNVGSPNVKNYSASVNINGSTVYSGSLTHYHHTRWSRRDWHGTDPGCKPQHNAAYLRSSKLVPAYAYTSPTAAAFSGLASSLNPTPFALGNWSSDMGSTGEQPAIGLLPKWEALYCTSGDSRAYDATISNFRGAGRWPTHYRDENTGRVVRPSSYASMTLTSGWGTPPPAASGGGPTWDIPHHPSAGYLPYLIEGRWSQMEELQFTAMVACLESNQTTRKNGSGATGLSLSCVNAPMTTRGVAWSWRTVGQAAAISPRYLAGVNPASADSNVRNDFVTAVQDSADWMRSRYVLGTIDSGTHLNTIGWVGHYDQYRSGEDTFWWGGSWMVAFQGMALSHISELEIEGMTSAANLGTVRDFVLGGLVSMVTASDTTPNWRRLATYDWPYLKSSSGPSSPVFATPAESYAAYKTRLSLGSLTFAAGSTLKAHSSNTDMTTGDTSNVSSGYGALKYSCLCMAADAGVSGAATARDLVNGASNFNQTAAHDNPVFAIGSRTRPAWLLGKALYEVVSLQSPSAFASFPSPAPPGSNPFGSLTDAWGGAAIRRNGSEYMLHGGGHGDGSWNAIMGIRLEDDSPAWRLLFPGTPNASITSSTNEYADGNPAAQHTYSFLAYDDTADELRRFCKGQYTVGGLSAGNYGWSYGAANWKAANTYTTNGAASFTYPHSVVLSPSGDAYCCNGWERQKWTKGTNTWSTPISSSSVFLQDTGACYDSTRDKVVVFGGNQSTSNRCYTWTIAGNVEATPTLTGTDAADLSGVNQGLGAEYDPVADLYWVYDRRGRIYSVTPSFVVTRITTTGTALPDTSASSATWPYNKFRYVANLGGIVIQPTWTRSLLFMRTR